MDRRCGGQNFGCDVNPIMVRRIQHPHNMPISDEYTDDLVDRTVREILAEREHGTRSSVAEKVRELGISKYRIHRRLKDVGPRTTRKPVNYKLSAVQEASLL